MINRKPSDKIKMTMTRSQWSAIISVMSREPAARDLVAMITAQVDK